MTRRFTTTGAVVLFLLAAAGVSPWAHGAPPAAEFEVSALAGTAPLRVQFTDASTAAEDAPPTLWYWNFGDGATSREQHPRHSYKRPGVYTVSLVAANRDGAASRTHSQLIHVAGAIDEGVSRVEGIIGAAGGELILPDGTALILPPGALAEDTHVRLTQIYDRTMARPSRYYRLEPMGLRLAKPGRLEMMYDAEYVDDPSLLFVYGRDGETTDLGKQGGEEPVWEPVKAAAGAVVSGYFVLSLALGGFKLLASVHSDPVYVVPYIPGRYLEPGDLIYTMCQVTDTSEEVSWIPGHSAMYLGTQYAPVDHGGSYKNDGRSLIESLPAGINVRGTHDHWNPRGWQFVYNRCYMGARRYPGELTVQDRNAICAYALSKQTELYSLIGQGNLQQRSYSCVGLLEASYDSVGKSIVPGILEYPLLMPKEHYDRGVPVDEITVPHEDAESGIAFPVYGVRLASRSIFQSDYENFAATATELSAGMSLEGNLFRFQASEPGSYSVVFRATHEWNGHEYTASQSLTIHVSEPLPTPPEGASSLLP